MVDIFAIFSTAFIVAFSGALMPGPLLTFTIAETARRGFMAGPLVILGHAILEIALILVLAGGLSFILTMTGVSHFIAVAGGVFLLYMGAGMVRDAADGRISLKIYGLEGRYGTRGEEPGMNQVSGVQRNMRPVLGGILFSISNPYWILWWATIGLGYITLSLQKGVLGITAFFSGHILADLVWYSLISATVAGGRKFLSDRVYSGIIVACGIFFLGLGGYFLYYGMFM
jgi:threonine/homoserine/homoserine lactone efflux protein